MYCAFWHVLVVFIQYISAYTSRYIFDTYHYMPDVFASGNQSVFGMHFEDTELEFGIFIVPNTYRSKDINSALANTDPTYLMQYFHQNI